MVIVAPADANMLFCMDARDGQIKWRTDREALLAGGRYLCGVRQDVAWVAGDGGYNGAGSTRLVGVNVRNGREAHSVRPSMAGGGMLALAGRPCIAGGRLFWPGYNGGGCSICAIDLDAARVVMDARAPAGYAGVGYSTYSQHGLLMTVSGADYSAGNSQFSLRCDMNELLETARRQAAADPGNPDGLLRLGMLQLRMGSQRAEALKTLRQAFEDAARPPVNARVREQAARALVGAHLERADALHAQRKFAEAHEQIKLAQAFALLRSQRSDCFVRLERTLQAQGDAAGLRALYEDLLENDPDFGVGEDPEIPARMYGLIRLAAMIETEDPARAAALYQAIQEGPERLTWQRTRLRAFGLAGLKGLVRAAGREVYKPQDDAAQTLLQSKDPGALLEILQRYPLSLAADDAALRLAADALKRRDPAQATRQLLAALEDNTQRPRRAEMQAWLALAHEAAGEKLRARLLSARTLREFPAGSITREGKTIAFIKWYIATPGRTLCGPIPRRRPAPVTRPKSPTCWKENATLGSVLPTSASPRMVR
jgi:tetratricopeptide (TPR) repeat protein